MEQNNIEVQEKEEKVNYLLYAILFVIILILATVAVTYAYFKFNVSNDTTLVNVSSSLECINLSLSDNGTSIGLSHKYPITDELATTDTTITPVTVTVTNNCSEAKKYTLSLSTIGLTNSLTSYIEDNKIRYQVLKNDTVYKSADYLSNLGLVSTSNQAYNDLSGTNGELATKYPDYTVKNIYAIEDTISIGANSHNKYDIYLWVDYYEGDSAMYSDSNATHDEAYDATTEGKKFAAAISLSLNP